MPKPDANEPEPPSDQETGKSLPHRDIDAWLETLRRSDRSLYNMMALEVWSIAKTMDGLIPGFWNRFMENRRASLKQFMQQKQTQKETPDQHPPQSDSESEG